MGRVFCPMGHTDSAEGGMSTLVLGHQVFQMGGCHPVKDLEQERWGEPQAELESGPTHGLAGCPSVDIAHITLILPQCLVS